MLTEHVVEVREGQDSEGFDRYPYEEVDDQSFSVLVEGIKRGWLTACCVISALFYCLLFGLAGPRNNTYAVLQSLDLICDSSEEQQLWCQAVCRRMCISVTCLYSIITLTLVYSFLGFLSFKDYKNGS